MRPRSFFSRIWLPSACAMRKPALRFTSSISRHCASLTVSAFCTSLRGGDAAWTKSETVLNFSMAAFARESAWPGTARSKSSLSTARTFAPSSSSARAMAWPMPCAAPVTSAVSFRSSWLLMRCQFFLPPARDEHVGGRDDEQREDGAEQQAADDDPADRLARLGAGAGGERERQRAEHHRARGHEDRPQPQRGGLDHRAGRIHALAAQLVGELDDKDAVLGDEADQHHQADLRIDV